MYGCVGTSDATTLLELASSIIIIRAISRLMFIGSIIIAPHSSSRKPHTLAAANLTDLVVSCGYSCRVECKFQFQFSIGRQVGFSCLWSNFHFYYEFPSWICSSPLPFLGSATFVLTQIKFSFFVFFYEKVSYAQRKRIHGFHKCSPLRNLFIS